MSALRLYATSSFLVRTPRNNHQGVIRHHRHSLRVDRLDDRIRCRRQKAVPGPTLQDRSANRRNLNSMYVEPILVLEQRAKQRRNLPIMISLGARWKRKGGAQNVAPMLKQFRLAVGRSMYWQHTSNRRNSKPPIRLSFIGRSGE